MIQTLRMISTNKKIAFMGAGIGAGCYVISQINVKKDEKKLK